MAYPASIQLAPISRLVRHGLLAFDYELMLEDTYRGFLREGNFVVDVGAHIGRHLFKFAELVGNTGCVAAFEPLPDKFEYLTGRCAELALTNVRLFNLALANFEGRSSFTHAVGTPEESGLRQRIFNIPERADPATIEVTVSTLDAILSDVTRLDYIKMDIEGGELDCLLGARSLVQEFRPYISIEFGRPSYSVYGKTPHDLLRLIQEINYRIFDIFCIEYHNEVDFLENVDGFFWDYFLVPREKCDHFARVTAQKLGPEEDGPPTLTGVEISSGRLAADYGTNRILERTKSTDGTEGEEGMRMGLSTHTNIGCGHNTILRFSANDPALRTMVGERLTNSIRLGSETGCGLHGPYVDLPAGRWIARIAFEGPSEGRVTMDMSAETGKIVLASRVIDLSALEGRAVALSAALPRPFSACEVRLYCEHGVRADISSVEIELDRQDPTRFRKLNFGCGYDKREDYLNIDMDLACYPDLVIQDNDFSLVPKNHFEEILAWDVLEHIPRTKTLSALLDWAEFLRMDGKLILQTSSILGVARLLDQTKSYADHHNYTIYLYGNQAHPGDFHLTGFTETTLRVHLEAAGFETGLITTKDNWLFSTDARKTYDWTELSARADLDTPHFIEKAYEAALYCAPDDGGHEFLTRMLQDEGWSRRDALRHLFDAPERLLNTAKKLGL